MSRCLYCYELLEESETDFHKRCSKKMFGLETPPEITTSLDEMKELAKEIVIRSVAVTGVQPKLSLIIEPQNKERKRSRFTIVDLWGDYILKPPAKQFPFLPENEDLTMHLAALAGIEVANHCLIRLRSGELAYITKRFDRAKGKKLPMEDMCQLSGNLTADKYNSSMEQVSKLILKYSTRPGLDAVNFLELAIFSFLTGNADMHLKNFSLLSSAPGDITLSPAYDLLSTALAIPGDKEELALTLNARKNKLRLSDFKHLAERMNINDIALNRIYTKLEKRLPQMLNLIKISFLPDRIKNKYIEILLSRAKRIFP